VRAIATASGKLAGPADRVRQPVVHRHQLPVEVGLRPHAPGSLVDAGQLDRPAGIQARRQMPVGGVVVAHLHRGSRLGLVRHEVGDVARRLLRRRGERQRDGR